MPYDNRHHEFTSAYNHKLNMHVNTWSDGVMQYIEQLRPKIIKVLDPNAGALTRVKELVPDSLVIYRRWVPDQPLGVNEDAAFDLGATFARVVAAESAVQSGLVDLVEGYNEILGETRPDSEHRKYAAFQHGLIQELSAVAPNVQPIAFNFGTGNMSGAQIMDLYGSVLAIYSWLGFHEYDWPTMDRLHKEGLAAGNEGMWLCLRYRRIMEPIIEALGDNWSVLVTECGMTQGVHEGAADIGYRADQNTVPGNGTQTPISDQDYFETLKWYSEELAKDNYVAGACMFTTGATFDWQTFDVVGSTIPAMLADYQQDEGIPPMDNEIFVNDVRDENDASLDVISRITSYEQLQAAFGLTHTRERGADQAQDGEWYWRLVGFEVRTGVSAYLTQVKDRDGNPLPDILVWRHWPDVNGDQGTPNPTYYNTGVAGFTDGSGVQGSPYGGGSVTGPNGGVDSIWLNVDPPGQPRQGSDMAYQLGWIGGTDHLTANPIFQEAQKGNGTEPPIDPPIDPPVVDGDEIVLAIGGQVVYRARLRITVEEA